MYGHIAQLAEAEKAGLKKAGIEADIYQYVSVSNVYELGLIAMVELLKLFLKRFSLRYLINIV